MFEKARGWPWGEGAMRMHARLVGRIWPTVQRRAGSPHRHRAIWGTEGQPADARLLRGSRRTMADPLAEAILLALDDGGMLDGLVDRLAPRLAARLQERERLSDRWLNTKEA